MSDSDNRMMIWYVEMTLDHEPKASNILKKQQTDLSSWGRNRN